MSSWWPNACTNATTSPVVVHRHGDAQIGQVADAALGLIDVVVEEDVAGLHRLDGEVADDRLDERGVRAARQLAAVSVVDAGSEVAGLADHRRAGGALDGGFDLGLGGGERALDDLDDDRIDHGLRARSPGCRMRPRARTRPGMIDGRRAELLDDRRPVHAVFGLESLSRIDRASARNGRRSRPRAAPSMARDLGHLRGLAVGDGSTGVALGRCRSTRRLTHSMRWSGYSAYE